MPFEIYVVIVVSMLFMYVLYAVDVNTTHRYLRSTHL